MAMKKFHLLTLADLANRKPHFTKDGNTKLGKHVWVWSTMKGDNNEIRYVNKLNGYCSGTCGKYCQCCTKDCYVNRSYRYGSVILGHAVNTVWLKSDLPGTFQALSLQIKQARNKPTLVRINQSGELMSATELASWIALARETQAAGLNTQFYVYTKNYDAVKTVAAQIETRSIVMPTNFTILLSIWHYQGVETYKALNHYPWIKAFIYDDAEPGSTRWTPTTYCKAYNTNGKMNHDITCDKCRKCFDRNPKHKAIGCYAH